MGVFGGFVTVFLSLGFVDFSMVWGGYEGLIGDDLDVLDLGCGKERHRFNKYDPFTHPDVSPLMRRWDRVTCNYVFDVQPSDHLIVMLLLSIRGLVAPGGKALIACRNDLAEGHVSLNGSHQQGREFEEWAIPT